MTLDKLFNLSIPWSPHVKKWELKKEKKNVSVSPLTCVLLGFKKKMWGCLLFSLSTEIY